ncbi:MAG: TPR repeat protein [Verrucomicrobiales bacterium]|jgi:TPR repeat protein
MNRIRKILGKCVLLMVVSAVASAGDFAIDIDEIDGAPEAVINIAKRIPEEIDGAAFKSLQELAAKGDAFAALVVGHCQEWGLGTERVVSDALASYKVAAEGGVVAGMRRYGSLLRSGSTDFRAAREWLGKADAEKDLGAMLELARMDVAGQGIARPDVEKAQFLMKAAAEAGSVDAMIELGRGFKQGMFGTEPSYEEAKRWFELGESKGDAIAALELGFLYEEGKGVVADADRAHFFYRAAAQKQLPQAQFHLGMCALKGAGIDKDGKVALEWFHKAASLGSTRAMYQLARMHEAGAADLKKDPARSNEWFEKAAALGDLRSQNQLGIKYRDGRGVEKDTRLAVKWLSGAASQRYPPAMVNLGMMYENGYDRAIKQDPVVASHLYTEAAKLGDAVGQYLLARLFETGKGGAKDLVAAYVLAAESARLGHKPAAKLSSKLKAQLTPEQLITAESRLKLSGR